MRTTLKRGMGRGAAGNGNGHAVFPPAVVTPMTRYRQPDPPRRSALQIVGRALLLLVAGIVMVAVALGGGYFLFLHQSAAALRPASVDVKKAQKRLQVPIAGRPTIALVVGYDKRVGHEANAPSRSDTIMLLRADPIANTISMLSFPRDLLVEDRCPGKPPFRDRINAAYGECGSRGTLETVKALTGLDINYLITVNFVGFRQIVSRLGGVWIDVDRRYFNNNAGAISGFNTYATIDLKPGYQKLNGQDALDYVRFRHTDSDIYRLARQQQFVRAMKEQATHSFVPLSVPRIVGAVTANHNVEIGVGGTKQIDLTRIVSYAFFAYKLPAGHLFQAHIDGLTGTNELEAPQANIDRAVQDFLHPDVNAPSTATDVALGRKPRASPAGPRPRNVSIVPVNGNGVTGSAANAAYLLAQRGYRILVPPGGRRADAPRWNYAQTQVYFDPHEGSARAAADKVARLIGNAVAAPMPPEIAPLKGSAMLVVVVGQTFHNALAPTPQNAPPKRQPPVVRDDPGATIGRLKPLARRVPFRLELPGVLERSSTPDPEVPVRLYEIRKHKAIRLTYKMTTEYAGYWGIEETDWLDAPVLQGPNATRLIGGREFDFYYSGSHLHMVALRQNGAVYWVVNTLLDSLSNETMLAIAKGLRPLAR